MQASGQRPLCVAHRLGNFPGTVLTRLSHHVGKPETTPSNFVGDLTNFSSTNFRFTHGTTLKTTQMQPAKLTAQNRRLLNLCPHSGSVRLAETVLAAVLAITKKLIVDFYRTRAV